LEARSCQLEAALLRLVHRGFGAFDFVELLQLLWLPLLPLLEQQIRGGIA